MFRQEESSHGGRVPTTNRITNAYTYNFNNYRGGRPPLRGRGRGRIQRPPLTNREGVADGLGQSANNNGPPMAEYRGQYRAPGAAQHTKFDHQEIVDGFRNGSLKLGRVFGEINKMTKDAVIEKLGTLSLSPHGKKKEAVLRLKNFYRRQRMYATEGVAGQSPQPPDKYFDYLLVIDLECTCEDGIYAYEHEIIEFPVVLVKCSTLEVVDEFHSYVQPRIYPVLSEFCTQLTGISQEQVDTAPFFLDVLEKFTEWMEERRLGTEYRYAIVTDGPWDLGKFFQLQCCYCGLDAMPHQFRHWINARRVFSQIYQVTKDDLGAIQKGKRPTVTPIPRHTTGRMQQNNRVNPSNWLNLQGMLDALGMTFEGHPHSGRDDSLNIARIVIRMLKDGAELRINERLLRKDRANKMFERRHQEYQQREQRQKQQQPTTTSPTNGGDLTMMALKLTECPLNEPSTAQNTEESTKSTAPEYDDLDGYPNQAEKDRAFWREFLNYKVVTVSKHEFLMDLHEECQTCDEASSESGADEPSAAATASTRRQATGRARRID